MVNKLPITARKRKALAAKLQREARKYAALAYHITNDSISLENLTEELTGLGYDVNHEFTSKGKGTFFEGFGHDYKEVEDINLQLTRMSSSMEKDVTKFGPPNGRRRLPLPPTPLPLI